MSTIVNTRQFETWNGTDGRHWAEHHERYDAMASGITAPLLAAAGIGADDQVLDIGCGAGQTTRLAARAAPRGRAVGVDLSAPLLERARRTAAAEGVINAVFEQGDAEIHPFPAARFDVVISRAGVLFFTDSVAAFANIGTAVRPGGRLAFVCHRDPDESVQAVFAALAEHLPPGDLATDAPDVANFADPAHVRGVLTGAGFTTVTIEGVEAPTVLGTDATDATDFLLAGQLRPFVGDADEPARQRAREAVITTLRPYETHDGIRIPARGWLVTAVWP